ncbi:DUF305 domain-containing protein [Labrys sp. ZIDIC5]|uniref:DUF305 domain-containing protein n=1 Tax=Labrys sedimenti TaxID=3106036 RepID=UPI002ACA01B2|nr:DUF305 domain-containing protein [Labrys sp. ZIDIC5]MDZ5453526.1 DUF305 domain-containing protein [Labrys sp. ZIDIC5]
MTVQRRAAFIGLAWILAAGFLPAAAHDAAHHGHEAMPASAEAPFLQENDAAMSKMMSAMAVKPTGNVDRDFTEMMIPHHQGAIDMAQTYLRYGRNEQLRRIAQEIIVEQQQEIAAMRLAVGDPPPAPAAAPTQVDPSVDLSLDPPANGSVPPPAMSMTGTGK